MRVIIFLLFISMFAAPEISDYFKNRGLPSESDLKQGAIKKFDQYRVDSIDDDNQIEKFAELGNANFPYSINYSYVIDTTHRDELYLYSEEQKDWILVSETKTVFENKQLKEVSDWNLVMP